MKSAMLPLGLGFLGLLFCIPPKGVNRQKLLFSTIVLLLLSAPLVAMLTRQVGRLSYGEAWRLNYLWKVNGLQDFGWTGGSPEVCGTPEHPPRKLVQTPLTLEFAYPIGGTYPLWNDPSYWYTGAKARFDLRQQLLAVKKALRTYKDILMQTAAYVAGVVVLLVLCLHNKLLPIVPKTFWWLLAWPLAAFSMYALVRVAPRYVSPFFVLFWLMIYSMLILPLKGRSVALILATVVCAVMLPCTVGLVHAGGRTMRDFVRPRQSEDYETIAVGLHNLGLHSGDRLALVGSAFWPDGSYPIYARIDRLRVVAQIPEATEFWRLGTQELESLEESLAAIGVKAIVARDRPDCAVPANWRDITVNQGVRFSILLLPGSRP